MSSAVTGTVIDHRGSITIEQRFNEMSQKDNTVASSQADSLEAIVEKARQLALKVLAAKEKYEGFTRSYDYYQKLPGTGTRCEANSRALLKEISELLQQQSELQAQQDALLREFSEFDSSHHVTYLPSNGPASSFNILMNEMNRNMKFYDSSLSSLRGKFSKMVGEESLPAEKAGWCHIL